jgi:hypothetical protein
MINIAPPANSTAPITPMSRTARPVKGSDEDVAATWGADCWAWVPPTSTRDPAGKWAGSGGGPPGTGAA